jgi:ureidoglycolate dehydrogenase (NAD+)
MAADGVLIDDDALQCFVAAIFAAKGMGAADAATVADVLVWAELRGVPSHGVIRVPRYLDFIAQGDMDPAARPEVTRSTDAAFLLEGHRAAGPVAMTEATDEAVARARRHGTALGLVAGTTHAGAVGCYAQRAASRGMAALVMAAGTPFMAYHGARVPSLATSPIAIAVPHATGEPLLLDMATSVAAMGRVNAARVAGRPIPEGWALDRDGRPTTDPAAAATLLPLGGAKGSGLALMIECLTGLVAGAPILTAVLTEGERRHSQNALILAIDIAAFRPLADFARDADALADAIRHLPRAEGVEEIRLPGERGDRLAAIRQRDGVPIPGAVWRQLAAIVEPLSVPLPALRPGTR